MNDQLANRIKNEFHDVFESKLINEIASLNKIQHCKSGNSIVSKGNYITYLPIILSGSVKVLREDDQGNELLMYYINKGDTCAMSLTCCMSQRKSMIKAICEEDTDFIAIPAELHEKWLKQYPGWKQFVMRTYQNRFEELLNTIDSIAFAKMDERLVNYLNIKIKQHGNDLQVTHNEIANELNTSREVISRLLKQLENNGKIKLSRNRIKILADL